MENEIRYVNLKNVTLIERRKAEVDAELKLQSAKRKLELSNKCAEIKTKRMILKEKRQLNDYQARRALSCVRAGKPVPILNDLPWGILETVSLDNTCPKLSSVAPVSANDILCTRDPESIARAHALSMEKSREAWKPPPERNKTTKSHSSHVPIPSGVTHGP